MVQTCFICKWRSDKSPRRSFHSIPVNADRRRQWLDVIGKSHVSVGKRTPVCSIHFDKNSFRFGLVNGRELLKPGSVPSLHLTKTLDLNLDDNIDYKELNNEPNKSTIFAEPEVEECVITKIAKERVDDEMNDNRIDLEAPLIVKNNKNHSLRTTKMLPIHEKLKERDEKIFSLQKQVIRLRQNYLKIKTNMKTLLKNNKLLERDKKLLQLNLLIARRNLTLN